MEYILKNEKVHVKCYKMHRMYVSGICYVYGICMCLVRQNLGRLTNLGVQNVCIVNIRNFYWHTDTKSRHAKEERVEFER